MKSVGVVEKRTFYILSSFNLAASIQAGEGTHPSDELITRQNSLLVFDCRRGGGIAGHPVACTTCLPATAYPRDGRLRLKHVCSGRHRGHPNAGLSLGCLSTAPKLRFRRNVFLGHVLVFIGELSLFLSMPSAFDGTHRSRRWGTLY
jgi:hypothetical protein